MNKQEIRPLLLEALMLAEEREEQTYLAAKANQEVLEVMPAWKEARLLRAQAELQLWLADRQWEREEREKPSLVDQLSASPFGKT